MNDYELWFEKQNSDKEKLLKKCNKIERKHYFAIDFDLWLLIVFISALATTASSLTLIVLVIRCYIVV